MFDFGFSEIMLIALVMLVVVGPKRLPTVARTAGHLITRMQRYVSDVKADISREMQLEDLKKLQKEVETQARDLEKSVRDQMNRVEGDLKKGVSEIENSVALGHDRPADDVSKPPMPDTHKPAAVSAIPVEGNPLSPGAGHVPDRQAEGKQ